MSCWQNVENIKLDKIEGGKSEYSEDSLSTVEVRGLPRWLRLCPPEAGAPVRSLVRELDRSHILQPRPSMSKNKK